MDRFLIPRALKCGVYSLQIHVLSVTLSCHAIGGINMPATLTVRLIANGCDIPLKNFKAILKGVHREFYPNWSVDELLLHPDEAKHFCDVIRRQNNVHGLPDDLVLRCHISNRKNPTRSM